VASVVAVLFLKEIPLRGDVRPSAVPEATVEAEIEAESDEEPEPAVSL
jgi:hypothetical protein